MNPESFQIRIFADGAAIQDMLELARHPLIRGFTTNPTLMRKAGVADYAAFAAEVLAAIPEMPVSFEVFADDLPTMRRQARALAALGANVYVKLPITNTAGDSTLPLAAELARDGVRLNLTALTTLAQVEATAAALKDGPNAFVSVFAGRIADTGIDPLPLMRQARALLAPWPQLHLLWASPREVLNLVQAEAAGCHVITMTRDLIAKIPLLGRPLEEVSLDTVRMFHRDAAAAGYSIPLHRAAGA